MPTNLIIRSSILLGICLSAGCASTQPDGMESSSAGADELAAYRSQLVEKDKQIAELERRAARTPQPSSAMTAVDDGTFPPDPQPGSCYARVMIPAKYESITDQVLKREASERVELVDAQYEWTEETLVDREASTRLEVIPAQYDEVTERVMVRPATFEMVTVPAEYETVTEQVVDVPAHTTWKRGPGPISGALETTVDEKTGEVLCLVDVPATYKTLTRQELKSPATVERREIAAEYETVTKRVVVEPAQVREIEIPAEYKTVKVQKLVSPPQENRIPVPAEYENVTTQRILTEEKMVWRDVLCETNMTASTIRNIQTKLDEMGYFDGRSDGVIGAQTLSAVNRYARANNLPTGDRYISMETVTALGIDI